ncbi:DeoR/GlpR family DNA-binding transcription regulator [Pisciglobus halotolerans]|uniref:Lactose phosphotransferase system repressor n=1 Tax=Pisciglobus halotolerans TaxID=745365 RepID=A0A1I3D065_9LACT|nr:DeoR/GlpR family DNA-binding transcription regulator [Pisciglobus halotolerans]SFH80018.1 transcriptional regulator, DeoR family [Pisciglobus halotolerans]
MLKKERLSSILEALDTSGVVTVQNIVKELNVSDMTVRRDLEELAHQGKIIRIHGGAQSLNHYRHEELSHIEKKEIHISEKLAVAETASRFIDEGDSIFLGPGTTIELIVKFIHVKSLRIVTNSLPVFNLLEEKNENFDTYLVGGSYRKKTGAFVGSIANETISKLKVGKAFVGVNGISNDAIFTANVEEGSMQNLILNNAQNKFIVADYHKFNKEDFYEFYRLTDIDQVITNRKVNDAILEKYKKYTTIMTDTKS